MKTTKAAAIFVIIVGISMLGMWGEYFTLPIIFQKLKLNL